MFILQNSYIFLHRSDLVDCRQRLYKVLFRYNNVRNPCKSCYLIRINFYYYFHIFEHSIKPFAFVLTNFGGVDNIQIIPLFIYFAIFLFFFLQTRQSQLVLCDCQQFAFSQTNFPSKDVFNFYSVSGIMENNKYIRNNFSDT